MTGEEAAAALKAGVEALFAEARSAEPHERTAYVSVGKPGEETHYVFDAFLNGHYKEPTGLRLAPPFDGSLEKMVASMVDAVATRFPAAASQCVVWRIEPEYEWHPASAGSEEYELPSFPAHHSLYCRLVGLPLGVQTSCQWCGMPHAESQPHFLTERSLEWVIDRYAREFPREETKLSLRVIDAGHMLATAFGSRGQ